MSPEYCAGGVVSQNESQHESHHPSQHDSNTPDSQPIHLTQPQTTPKKRKTANTLSAVFQAGGLVVVLVEVSRKSYLASIVPVIVNAILNEHQIIVDIVAFVSRGDFPRSRLGEKQRGKLLAGWVTRKMSTLAQFAIRDLDAAAAMDGAAAAVVGSDAPLHSNRNSSHSLSGRSLGGGGGGPRTSDIQAGPPRIVEHEEYDVPERTGTGYGGDGAPPPPAAGWAASSSTLTARQISSSHGYNEVAELPPATSPPPSSSGEPRPPGSRGGPPQIRLPGVDGREPLELWGSTPDEAPAQTAQAGAAGQRDEDNSWEADAIMHMNLTGDLR